MNPRYEPMDQAFRRLNKDLQTLKFQLMYADLATELATLFAVLRLKRGCRR